MYVWEQVCKIVRSFFPPKLTGSKSSFEVNTLTLVNYRDHKSSLEVNTLAAHPCELQSIFGMVTLTVHYAGIQPAAC